MTFNRPVLCPDCGEDLNLGELQVFAFPGQCAKCQSATKMADLRTQDDLVHLFSNNLHFSDPQAQPQPQPQPTHQNPTTNGLGYSPSRPYHHSSHQGLLPTPTPAPPTFQQPQQPSPPPEHLVSLGKAQLTAHGIPPSALNAPQLTLFSLATDDQKRRLIQLWQIAAQNNGSYATFGGGEPPLSPTFTDQEDATMEDSAPSPTLTGAAADRSGSGRSGEEEPYMASGYEMLAAREYESGARSGFGERTTTTTTYSPLGSALGPTAIEAASSAQVVRDEESMSGDETKAMVSEGWWRHEPAFAAAAAAERQPVEHQYGLYQQVGFWGVGRG